MGHGAAHLSAGATRGRSSRATFGSAVASAAGRGPAAAGRHPCTGGAAAGGGAARGDHRDADRGAADSDEHRRAGRPAAGAGRVSQPNGGHRHDAGHARAGSPAAGDGPAAGPVWTYPAAGRRFRGQAVTDSGDPQDLDAYFEALLFIAERPLSTDELAKLGRVPRLHAEGALTDLAERLAEDGRGLRLQRNEEEW